MDHGISVSIPLQNYMVKKNGDHSMTSSYIQMSVIMRCVIKGSHCIIRVPIKNGNPNSIFEGA